MVLAGTGLIGKLLGEGIDIWRTHSEGGHREIPLGIALELYKSSMHTVKRRHVYCSTLGDQQIGIQQAAGHLFRLAWGEGGVKPHVPEIIPTLVNGVYVTGSVRL